MKISSIAPRRLAGPNSSVPNSQTRQSQPPQDPATPEPQDDCDCDSNAGRRRNLWQQGGMVAGIATGVYAGAGHGFYALASGAAVGGMVGAAAGLVIGDGLDGLTGNDDKRLPRYLAGGLGIAGGIAGAFVSTFWEGPLPAVLLGGAGAVAGIYLALSADTALQQKPDPEPPK